MLPVVTTWLYSVSKNWDVLYDKFYLPFYIFIYSEYNIMANFITLSKCRKQIHGYNMKFKHSPRLLLFEEGHMILSFTSCYLQMCLCHWFTIPPFYFLFAYLFSITILLLLHPFFFYLTCSCPYTHAILW